VYKIDGEKERRKLHNEKHHYFFSAQNNIRVILLGIMRWLGVGQKTSEQEVLEGNTELSRRFE
jgi:hypothetical protein